MPTNDEILIYGQLRVNGIIKDKTFNSAVRLNLSNSEISSHKHRRLRFEKLVFSEKFTISSLQAHLFLSITLEFIDCTFEDKIYVQDFDSPRDTVVFNNCSLGVHLSVRNVKTSVFNLNNCKAQTISIERAEGFATFSENQIEKDIHLLNVKYYHCDIKNQLKKIKTLRINSEELEYVKVSSRNTIEECRISAVLEADIQGDFDQLEISSENFNSISVSSLSIVDSNTLELKKAQINTLVVTSSKISGNLEINQISTKSLEFFDVYSPNGIVKISELDAQDASFVRCVIKDFYWTQISFKERPEIIGGDLSTVRLANVDWPAGHLLKDSFLKERLFPFERFFRKIFKRPDRFSQAGLSELKYERDAYRQLKVASFASQNTIEALKFYRNEMKLYWKEVRITGKEKWYDKILLFMGRWSSNFGQNWLLPILWISISSTSLYFLIKKPTIECDWDAFGSGVLEVLYYANPARKLPTVASATAGIDVLFRIINAYFIYHLIRATRKFAKI